MRVHRRTRGSMQLDQPLDLEQVASMLGSDRLLVISFSGRLSQIHPTVQRLDFGEELHQRLRFGFTYGTVAKEGGESVRVRDGRQSVERRGVARVSVRLGQPLTEINLSPQCAPMTLLPMATPQPFHALR